MARAARRAGALGALTLIIGGCQETEEFAPPGDIFVDLAAESGLHFLHDNGMSGEHYFSEMMGAGGAFFDFDNDGDLDIYLIQGRRLGPSAEAHLPTEGDGAPRDRLFRNDLSLGPDGEKRLTFTDVTDASGLNSRGYGMGVAVGDVDNDGWVDLYVTNFGPNQLWRNLGVDADGQVTFADATAEMAIDGTLLSEPRWSSSAAFLDFDRDGWLDLFVVNYTDFDIASHKPCPDARGAAEYCGPLAYGPEPDRLLRNTGPGPEGQVRFEDVSQAAGIGASPGYGLGVVTADFDHNGWLDIYVANDHAPNYLWLNPGASPTHPGITFQEDALFRGSAVDGQGRPEASMGVDAGDLDRDGDADLFMTHLMGETNTLYLNDGRGQFHERTAALGLAAVSRGLTAFGTVWTDVDNDGWLDLAAVNGEVRKIPDQVAAGDPHPLRQPNQLFGNQGGQFRDWSARASVLQQADVSRGLAAGDVDNDGDEDLLVLNNGGPAQLLINQIGQQRSWLGLRLVNRGSRDLLGARVALIRDGEPPLWRRVATDGSYLSAHDPRVLFGLGESDGIDRVEVVWPSGRRESWRGLSIDRYHTLVEGTGQEALP